MITLRVDPDRLHANPVHRALRLIKTLRDEGIPAFGAIALEGVESGTLSITAADLATGEVTYRWNEDESVVATTVTSLTPAPVTLCVERWAAHGVLSTQNRSLLPGDRLTIDFNPNMAGAAQP